MRTTTLLVVAVRLDMQKLHAQEKDITHYKLENMELFGGQHYTVVSRQEFLFQLNALKIGNPALDIALKTGNVQGASIQLKYSDAWFLTAAPVMSLVDLPKF